MPVFCSNHALSRGDGCQNFEEVLDTMRRQFYSFVGGVNEPAQYYFGCGPSSIALLHFLERSWFLPKFGVLAVEGPGHPIQGAEEDTFNPPSSLSVALDQAT